MDKMKWHRVILRRAVKVGRRWQDTPGWSDVNVDFGWINREDLATSIRKILDSYPDHRLLRHFAITAVELNNGYDRRLT